MFPPAVITHLTMRLSACLNGVIFPLGDRVRPQPSYMTQRSLLPERLVFHTQQWLMRRRSMIACLMDRIAAGKCRARAYKAREPKPDAIKKLRPEIPSEQWLPRMFAWVRRMAPEMGRAVEDMTRLLEEPEMKAMVLAAPQMARAWVPLLNAVGERKPEWWPKAPPRPRRPRKAGQRAKKPAVQNLDPVEAWRSRRTPPPPPSPAPLPQHGTWTAPQPPPPPPRRVTNYRELIESLRPVSQNFEPPPSD
jgi:hypothetical protein